MADIVARPAAHPAGLYVHVPFCLSRCPYCHFYSTTELSRLPDWVAAVQREAGFYQDRFRSFDCLYLGGGTPSLVPERILGDLLETLHRVFSLASDSEVTLEANPNDLRPSQVKRLKTLGINRISLGVQSLSDRDLAFLRRRHNAAEALQSVAWVREAGFENLSLDLMYGLPGQSLEAWLEILERTAALEPEHLSCYALTVEPHTPLGRRLAAGSLVLPSEQDFRKFFLETSRCLGRQGYSHYEVSNFARGPGQESRHNQGYWERRPYLGLGPAAHSFDGQRRWWNGRSLRKYLERLGQGRRPLQGQETLSPEQQRLESLLLGFRTRSGVAWKHLSLDPERKKLLRALERSGRVIRQRDRLIPTPKGFLLADRLPLLFV